jgi:uncharacterized membrane protein
MSRRGWTDQQIEAIVGNLLRAGVLLAAVFCIAGGAIYLLHHGAEAFHDHVFRGEPNEFRSVAGILADSLAGYGRGSVQLGVLLLIATPIARVTLCAFAFFEQRDRLYVGVTLFVLAVLLYSLIDVRGTLGGT